MPTSLQQGSGLHRTRLPAPVLQKAVLFLNNSWSPWGEVTGSCSRDVGEGQGHNKVVGYDGVIIIDHSAPAPSQFQLRKNWSRAVKAIIAALEICKGCFSLPWNVCTIIHWRQWDLSVHLSDLLNRDVLEFKNVTVSLQRGELWDSQRRITWVLDFDPRHKMQQLPTNFCPIPYCVLCKQAHNSEGLATTPNGRGVDTSNANQVGEKKKAFNEVKASCLE